jgi:hypothetical protein
LYLSQQFTHKICKIEISSQIKQKGVSKMLTYVLAVIVGFGSLAMYLAAFLFPEIHRKNDFIWSGVGLFYALVLWIFVPRITGGLLLGHVASVALLVWFGWQTLSLRRQLTPELQQTPLPSPELLKLTIQEKVANFSVGEKSGQLVALVTSVFTGIKNKMQQTVSKNSPVPIEKSVVEIIDKTTQVAEQPSVAEISLAEAGIVSAPEQPIGLITTPENLPEVTPPNPPSPELVAEAQKEVEEEKPLIPVEEIAPDAVFAPPAETPTAQISSEEKAGD